MSTDGLVDGVLVAVGVDANRHRRKRRPIRMEVVGMVEGMRDEAGWPRLLVRTHDDAGVISLRARSVARTVQLARGATVLVSKWDLDRMRVGVQSFDGHVNLGCFLKYFARDRDLPCWQRTKGGRWRNLPFLDPAPRWTGTSASGRQRIAALAAAAKKAERVK